MAEKSRRFPLNAAGRYYVDSSCIDCDLCRVTAPDNFAANEEEGHSFVARQPETEGEESLCLEAKEACPVEAIGSDGEEAADGPQVDVDGGARETSQKKVS